MNIWGKGFEKVSVFFTTLSVTNKPKEQFFFGRLCLFTAVEMLTSYLPLLSRHTLPFLYINIESFWSLFIIRSLSFSISNELSFIRLYTVTLLWFSDPFNIIKCTITFICLLNNSVAVQILMIQGHWRWLWKSMNAGGWCMILLTKFLMKGHRNLRGDAVQQDDFETLHENNRFKKYFSFSWTDLHSYHFCLRRKQDIWRYKHEI